MWTALYLAADWSGVRESAEVNSLTDDQSEMEVGLSEVIESRVMEEEE